MFLTLTTTLAVFLSVPVDVSWACAGNSYMAHEAVDYRKCDGWLMVDGDPVVQFWQGVQDGDQGRTP